MEKNGNKLKSIDLKKIINNIGIDKLLIIAICGVILVMLPSGSKSKEKSSSGTSYRENENVENIIELTEDEYCEKLEKRLENILCEIDGVGEVKVMITMKSTSEKVVLKEISYDKSSESNNSGTESVKESYKEEEAVVFEEDSEGNTIPYVIKENVPEIEGIAIVAEGGGNSENILKITGVVQALFGVSAHKISVIGMR
jgi:stage III sporulation protein AG